MPKGLLAAVAAINQKTREAYVAEQEAMAAKKMNKIPKPATPKADPAAHASASKMAEAVEGSKPRNEKEKRLAAMKPPYDKITHGDVLHGRGVRKEEVLKPGEAAPGVKGVWPTKEKVGVPASKFEKKKTPQGTQYTKKMGEHLELDEAKRIIHHESGDTYSAKVYRDPEYNEYQVHFFKHGKHMGEGPVSYHDDKEDAISTSKSALKQMHAKDKEVKEESDLLVKEGDYMKGVKRRVAERDAEKYAMISKKDAKEGKHVSAAVYDKMSKHAMKKANEEFEQIDELSKKTLRSYMAKAVGSKAAHDYAAGLAAAYDLDDVKNRNLQKSKKRTDGLVKAIVKTTREEVELIDELSQEKMTSYMRAAKKDINKNLRSGDPQPGSKRAAKVEKRVAGYRKAWAKVEQQNEEKDTPGNGYSHQCALHVKSEQFGEGRTLFSQHAEPDSDGNIEWYDVMFDEGIKRVYTNEIEILVSEAHMNHKKKKSM